MTPKEAAEGLVYGFKKIGMPNDKAAYECALYSSEWIMGSHPILNIDKSENEDWKFWNEVYNYLKNQ